jgi:hypothetical protein
MATTFQDAIEHLLDYVGGGGDNLVRDCRRAIAEAYRDLANAHRWSYFATHGRVITSPPFGDGTIAYDHTGGANERQVTLSGGVWPDWAAGAYLRVGRINCKIAQRVSATVLILDEQVNPGSDLDAGTEYRLIRDTYLLPADFIAQDQALYETAFAGMQFVHPREWLFDNRYILSEGPPRLYTITGDSLFPGRLVIRLSPAPSDGRTIDFIYQRRPRPLAIAEVSAGTVALEGDSATVNASGEPFTPAMVGSVLRVSSAAGSKPTSFAGKNPAAFETRIVAYLAANQVRVADPSPLALPAASYTVSDPIDFEEGAMLNAFFRCCEKCIAQSRTLKDKPSAQRLYQQQLNEARSADSRSFTGRAAGPQGIPRLRLRDRGRAAPDDI